MAKLSKYLRNRDLRLVEAMYQAVKYYPGFSMQNVFTYDTREHFAAYDQISRLFPNRSVRCNRLTVATHETGHAVVAAALGLYVHEVSVNHIPNHLDGRAIIGKKGQAPNLDAKPLTKDLKPLPSNGFIRMSILAEVAGFVAEQDRLAHHSRAYHEKILAYFRCRQLDEMSEKPALSHWHFFTQWASRIIKNNTCLFDDVLGCVLANKTLTQAMRSKLNETVKREPMQLFINEMENIK